eukprot:Gb_14286 [translate_table: standard]
MHFYSICFRHSLLSSDQAHLSQLNFGVCYRFLCAPYRVAQAPALLATSPGIIFEVTFCAEGEIPIWNVFSRSVYLPYGWDSSSALVYDIMSEPWQQSATRASHLVLNFDLIILENAWNYYVGLLSTNFKEMILFAVLAVQEIPRLQKFYLEVTLFLLVELRNHVPSSSISGQHLEHEIEIRKLRCGEGCHFHCHQLIGCCQNSEWQTTLS